MNFDEYLQSLIRNSDDPDTLAKALDMGGSDERDDLLGLQLHNAQGRLQTQQPHGREAGGTFVASNPLENLAATLNQGLGALETHRLMGEEKGLIGSRRKNRQAVIEALIKAKQKMMNESAPAESIGMGPQMTPDQPPAPPAPTFSRWGY